jgi:hypothetical protein
MNVTVRIPDDFAKRLGPGGLGRKALEALALLEYRAGRLTAPALSDALDFTTRAELGGFLFSAPTASLLPLRMISRIATSRPASAPSAPERPSAVSIPGR